MNILEKTAEKIAMRQAANIDCLVSRFCIENEARAEQVEIVNEQTINGWKTYVRLKS